MEKSSKEKEEKESTFKTSTYQGVPATLQVFLKTFFYLGCSQGDKTSQAFVNLTSIKYFLSDLQKDICGFLKHQFKMLRYKEEDMRRRRL